MVDRETVDRPLTARADLRGDVPVIGAGRTVAAAPPDPARAAAFLAELRDRLPDLPVRTDPAELEAHRRDETANVDPPLPLAVAAPASTAEVAEIVRLAAAYRVPIVPRGEGTGLSGGAIAVDGGLTVLFRRMARILEIDRENLVAVTQPGIINASFKAAVSEHGLFYPPDPASDETCSIGGNLGTNAGGLCCVKYGVTRDAVLGLEVVLADGSVIRTGGRNVKDVAGYDLARTSSSARRGRWGSSPRRRSGFGRPAPRKLTLLAFFATLEDSGRRGRRA